MLKPIRYDLIYSHGLRLRDYEELAQLRRRWLARAFGRSPVDPILAGIETFIDDAAFYAVVQNARTEDGGVAL